MHGGGKEAAFLCWKMSKEPQLKGSLFPCKEWLARKNVKLCPYFALKVFILFPSQRVLMVDFLCLSLKVFYIFSMTK